VSILAGMAAIKSGISIAKIDENRVVIPKSSNRRVAWWRVTLGKKITGSKKVRRFFAKESEAKQFIALTLESKQVEGHEAFILTPSIRAEARQCQEMLDAAAAKAGRRLSLTEAVGFFLRHALPHGGTRVFKEAAEEFLANRQAKNLKPRYLVNLRSQFRRLEAKFSDAKVNVITTQMIESWLNGLNGSAKTRNNYLITLRTFFDFCLKQKWCSENPANAVDKAALDEAPTEILSVDEAARLLASAQDDAALLPALAIQLFAGLRRSEVCALDWSEVRDDLIEVTAAKAKTRSRRVVTIQPNLAAWLQPFRQIQGRVFGRSEDAYNESLRALVLAANEQGAAETPALSPIRWKRNCLRHTAASMHLAFFESDNLTALQLGHGIEVLHRHYKGLVGKVEASRYWSLRPKSVCPIKQITPEERGIHDLPALRVVEG
jgi:integrase